MCEVAMKRKYRSAVYWRSKSQQKSDNERGGGGQFSLSEVRSWRKGDRNFSWRSFTQPYS